MCTFLLQRMFETGRSLHCTLTASATLHSSVFHSWLQHCACGSTAMVTIVSRKGSFCIRHFETRRSLGREGICDTACTYADATGTLHMAQQPHLNLKLSILQRCSRSSVATALTLRTSWQHVTAPLLLVSKGYSCNMQTECFEAEALSCADKDLLHVRCH